MRAQATDPLHNFRFHAKVVGDAGIDIDGSEPLQPAGGEGAIVGEGAEAGFQAITMPEYTLESVEYREGTRTYTLKFPGVPTTNDLTFTRGVARLDTAFYDWTREAIEGREYRADIVIYHFVRGARSAPTFNPGTNLGDATSKRYVLFDAFPIRVKVAGDADATSSDISLAELDIAYERFEIQVPA